MSQKLPVLKPRELISNLKSHGYHEISQSGSHLKMARDGKTVVTPIHQGRDLPPGLAVAILRQAGIDPASLRQ